MRLKFIACYIFGNTDRASDKTEGVFLKVFKKRWISKLSHLRFLDSIKHVYDKESRKYKGDEEILA